MILSLEDTIRPFAFVYVYVHKWSKEYSNRVSSSLTSHPGWASLKIFDVNFPPSFRAEVFF